MPRLSESQGSTQRPWGPGYLETLTCAPNWGASLVQLGECAEAAALLWTTLVAMAHTLGSDEVCTLCPETHLVSALIDLGEYA